MRKTYFVSSLLLFGSMITGCISGAAIPPTTTRQMVGPKVVDLSLSPDVMFGYGLEALSDGRVLGWGFAPGGDSHPDGLKDIVKVYAGIHACALSKTGKITCWGKQSLLGGDDDDGTPDPVVANAPTLPDAMEIVDGCALTSHSLICWDGSGINIPLDQPRNLVQVGPYLCAIDKNNQVHCLGTAEDMGIFSCDATKIPDDLGTVAMISGGTIGGDVRLSQFCAIGSNGIQCWIPCVGSSAWINGPVPVTQPPPLSNPTRLTAGDAMCFQSDAGLSCWEPNPKITLSPDSLTPPAMSGPISKLVGGAEINCAIDATGKPNCWGNDAIDTPPLATYACDLSSSRRLVLAAGNGEAFTMDEK